MESDQTQAAANRLAAKLDGLDLDDDEQAVLVDILGAGATSVEPVDDEVEGFALNAYLQLKGQKQGLGMGFSPVMDDEAPKETITFEYGGLVIRYGQQ